MMKLKSIPQTFQKYHPDINKEADAEEKFKEVSEAYEVIHRKKRPMTNMAMRELILITVAALVALAVSVAAV